MKFTLKKTLLTAVVMAMIGCVSKETKNTVHDGGAPGREYVVAPDGVGTNYTAAAPGPLFGLAERIAADWKAGAKGRHDEIVIRPGYYRFDCLPRVETRDTAPARIGLLLAGNALEVRGETGVAADVVLDGCGGEGRAFSFAGSGEVTVRGITFQNFRVTKASGAALAFGINATTNLVENCTFRGNSTDGSGGATLGANCRNCLFEGNRATKGGAYVAGDYRRIPVGATDCVFRGNTAEVAGGAGCGGVFTNCTFEANSCPTGRCSALVGDISSALHINRCVFRRNTAPLNYENIGWQFRSDGTLYGTGWNRPDSRYITDNKIEDCGYGFHGRWDGKAGVNTVTVKPGESILKARDFLRANRTPGKRAEIVLEDGVHMLTNCVELLGFDRDLTIRAKNAGRAYVAGGWNFRGREMRKSAVRPGLLEIDVPAWARAAFAEKGVFGGATHMFGAGRPPCPTGKKYERWRPPSQPIFTVDAAAMVPGRWPKDGRYFYSFATNIVQNPGKGETNMLFTTHTGRELTWNWDDADINVWGELVGCAFSKEVFHARGIDPKTKAIDFGKAKIAKNAHMYFLNVLEETDEPGEWCYERKTGKLYLCPPKGFRPDSICVLGTAWDHFFRTATEGVRIEGLVFTGKIGCTAVVLTGRRNAVVGCRFGGLGFNAVHVAGTESELRSCDFRDTMSTAAQVSGGSGRTMTAGGNVIENCTFRNCCYGQIGNHAPVVNCTGCGNRVAHNDIRDSIAPGIAFAGPDVVVEYNRIVNVTTDNGDSNAIGSSGTPAYGSIIRFNDVGGSPGYSHGIYVDDFGCGSRIYGNVVRNYGQFGIFLGGGRDNLISNNFVTAGWGGIHSDNRGLFWPAWKDQAKCWKTWCEQFGLPDSAFAKRYPKMCTWGADLDTKMMTAPIENEIVNNLFLDITGYGTSLFTCLNRHFPHERNHAHGNLVVRPVGVRPGYYDLAAGYPSNAPTNHMSTGTRTAFGPYVSVRVLDGTPEKPVDMGFKDVPPPAFDLQEFMYIEQGWLKNEAFMLARKEGRFDNIEFKKGDFNLKSDARVFKEIPGFQPIPWDKIGLYKDKWRTKLPQLDGMVSEIGR